MPANVIDIDFEVVESFYGVLFLFGFKAAFSSISHGYLFDMLMAIRLPLCASKKSTTGTCTPTTKTHSNFMVLVHQASRRQAEPGRAALYRLF